MALSTEKKKQIAAGALGAFALITIVWSLFFSDDSRPSTTSTANKVTAGKPGIDKPINQGAVSGDSQKNLIVLVSQPLELSGLSESTAPNIGRNIFIFPTPTPIPTPKPTPTPTPPPPPPITLAGLNPGNVIARTGDFDMTVFGAKIPKDAQVFINGAGYPTTILNESQARVKVPGAVIGNAGQLQVEVKGTSDPVGMYSNRLPLAVSAPPVPQYRYLGLIVKNGLSTAVIRDEGENDLQNVRKGEKLGKRWQVTNISPTEIEITDITINIKHKILFTGNGG